MGNQLAWATEVPRTVLPAAGRWEHEGTSTVEAAATAGTMGDGPIVVVKDDMAALLAKCRPDCTSVENLQHYL
jgi:hypothetical protein